jgi:membrane protein implicated in regulation of membrane protease activity
MGLAWIWVATLALSLVAEFIAKKAIALSVTASSLLSIILHFCKVKFVWQAVAFIALTALFLVLIIVFLPKIKGAGRKTMSFESVVGEKCTVAERIDNFAGCGLVKINGQYYSARGTEDTDVFEIGETLYIVAIEGVKLICKK